jgi:hypothetical protein
MRNRAVIIAVALTVASIPALAVEQAIGRTLPGIWIMPQAGVVGPEAGFSFSTLPIGYMGAIGGAREVPIGGAIVANLNVNVSANYLVPQYVYKTDSTKVSLSSEFLGLVNWVGASASAQLNDFSGNFSRSNGGLGDVAFVPLTVGLHFSENSNLALSAMVFAPTGLYRPANISNLGMNEWTVMPNFAYTYLWKDRGLEFDNFVGFDIYSKNIEVNYKSGTMFHWDGMVVQYLSKRFGFGGIVSNLTQITNDTGPIADRLHGFEGRAWGAGPMVVYVAKSDKPMVALQLRWINEFEVTNLMKGNVFEFGLTMKLK